MKIHTLWDRIKERVTGTPAPKKPRKPRQPIPRPIPQFVFNEKFIMDQLKEIKLSISNHHARIHELEQIEHRRSEREKEMKTNA